MSDTIDIGAARIRLIVDAAQFDPIIAQGKNAIVGFGNLAQQTYDKTEKGTRRAADALLDYVNSLGRADSAFDKYLRTASRMGVEKPVLDAAIDSWGRYQAVLEDTEAQAKKTAAATAGLRQLAGFMGEARQANAQSAFNTQLGVVQQPTIDYDKRQAAEDLWGDSLVRENEELERQAALEEVIANARSSQAAMTAQQEFNSLLGINNSAQQEAIDLQQRRADALGAFIPMLEEEAKLEQENRALVDKQQAFLQQLENIANTSGKTYYQMLQLKAAEAGVSEQAAPLIANIERQNKTMGAGTLSAKQYEFALRGLPAQFTDIVVSLQGGQKPLTVLLQQGGQIKDMFGGVGNAIKVVADKIKGLVTNPWVLLTGVVLALGAAALEAQSRMQSLALATAKGNQTAGSAEGLSTLAESLSKLDHTSLGNADAAVASLAAAGKLTGDNLNAAAQATARWATITGQGVDDIAGKFNDLASNPMEAVLNGTLKVTDAQYAQLEALDRTGQKAAEVTLAVKLYQDQVNSNSDEVLRHLSKGEQGWIKLEAAITNAWHATGLFVKEFAGSAFNRAMNPSLSNFATAGMSEGALDLSPDSSGSSLFGGGVPAGAGAGTDKPPIASAPTLTPLQANSNKEAQRALDEYGTKTQKFNTQLMLLQGTLTGASDGFLKMNNIIKSSEGTFSGAGYDKLVNGLRLKVFGQNAGGDPTRPIKEWEKTVLDSLKAAQVGVDAYYADGNINASQYYSVLDSLAKADLDTQLDSITKQQAAIKTRENTQAQYAQLEQQRQTVLQEYAKTKATNDRNELIATQAKIVAYHDYVQALADANIQIDRQGNQAAAAVGTGSREASLNNALSDAKYQSSLKDRAAQDAVDALPGGGDKTAAQLEANKKIAADQDALITQLGLIQSQYNKLTAAQSDWSNGAMKAWQDWSDEVSNVAAQTNTLFTGMFNDLTNDLAKFVKTGHLSFSDFISDALAQIEKSGIQYALQQAFKYLSSVGGSDDKDSVIGGGFGSIGTGIGTILSDIGIFAKGAAFGDSAGLSGYSNSVVTRPTYFPFARGGVPNVGLMGEKAGSPGEAIMPLTRTSGGELAVKTTGNAPAARNLTINQAFVVPGAQSRQTQSQLAVKNYGAAQRAARRS